MTSQQRDDPSLFSRVVREPLDAVVAPLVRDALIHDAVGVAKMASPPLERMALKGFVSGSLRVVLERALGAELGRSVVDEMMRVLATTPTTAPIPATTEPVLPRSSRPGPRIPRPRSMTGSRASSVPPSRPPSVTPSRPSSAPPPPSGRPSVPPSVRPSVPPSVRPSVPPPSGRPSVVPPSGRPSAVPDSVPPSMPPVSRTASTNPPAARSVHPPGLHRPRPTPVPYGMRRPTPPPGMIDARSVHPLPGGFARDAHAPAPVSGERSRAGSSRPPIPSSALPRVPMVLVATQDRAIFETLAGSFEDRARIRRVLSAADVVRELDEAGACRKIIILDAKLPPVRPAALAVLLESMPAVEVVICRSQADTEDAIAAVSDVAAKNWIIYREIAPLDRVAIACAELVS